jgi:hypothetical protein
MTYILYIWTVVAIAGDHNGISKQAMDWRPIGEYSRSTFTNEDIGPAEKCYNAAKQLGLKSENFRCVRNK